MARPRHKLEDLVRTLIVVAAERGEAHRGPEKLQQDLIDSAPRLGLAKTDIPGTSTIGRIRARFPRAEWGPYSYVRIPTTFDAGLLDWADADDVLGLWRGLGIRPSVKLARRFVHISQLVGRDVNVEERAELAVRLLRAENEPEILMALEKDLVDGNYAVDEDAEFSLEPWMIDWDELIELWKRLGRAVEAASREWPADWWQQVHAAAKERRAAAKEKEDATD